MKRWFAILLVCVLLVVVAAVYYRLSQGVPVRTARVTRGMIREFVDERGKTRLPETHLISMPFAGRVAEIVLAEGDSVVAGQVVAQIVQQDLDDELAEAQAAVDRLQSSIIENADISVEESTREQANLFAESMVATVAAAEARKIAGQSRLDFSETFLGRTRNLAQTGVETQEDLERAELDYVEDQVGYRQDVLVAEALKSMQSATNLLPRIVTEYIARKSLSGEVLQKEKLEAEARLRMARLRHQRGMMRTPVAGVVLERAVRDEQHLAAGTPLLRIGELDRLEVEADVLSEDVVRIRPGDPVEIYGPALGASAGQGVSGAVDRIYPAGFTKISSLGVEQQRVTVIVRFAEGALETARRQYELGVDYRVRVRIFTAEQADALLVPRSALFRAADGGQQVFAVRGRRVARVTVQTGLMNDAFAEIKAGLNQGDTVVLAPETTLEAGARVTLQE